MKKEIQQPNILLLYSDQHSTLAGCYGDQIIRTPNLNALADAGVVFDNCYCPSPICLPSRMSFLTAREPHAQKCWTNQDILPSGIPTFVHSLGAAGYETTLVGRLHSMGPDQMRGYGKRLVGDHSPNWIGGPPHDLGPLRKANDPWRESLTASGPGQSAYEKHDNAVTAAAVNSILEIGRQQSTGSRKPFAMTVGWLLPHAPYVCDPELYQSYEGKVPPPALDVPTNEHAHYSWWRSNRGVADASGAEIDRARTAYYGLVTTLDRMIGRVVAALDQAGLAENTMIIYTSDHGDHLGNRGLWWKSTLYDEAARVPLIISWPGNLPSGERRKAIVSHTDLAATILDFSRAPELPNSQGRSFAQNLLNEDSAWRDEAVSEYVNDGVPAWSGGKTVIQRMLRQGKFKYIYHHGQSDQLFDLDRDPAETSDLINDPEYAEIRARMLTRLLSDWDPDAIAGQLEVHRAEQQILGSWAKSVKPEEIIRWEMKEGDSWLSNR